MTAPRPRNRFLLGAMLALAAVGATSCSKDRIKRALNVPTGGDPVWAADSTMLASKPEVLFRVLQTKNGAEVVPIATVGKGGFRELQFYNRGWRAFDLEYLHSGHTLTQYREGRSLGTVTTKRGMWLDGGEPFDSVPGCQNILPSATVTLAEKVQLVTSGTRTSLKPATSIGEGEVQEALSRIPTLVAPLKGIPGAMLSKYSRVIHQMNNGSGGRPTLIVTYDDPEVVADTLIRDLSRPRQLIVFLDYGVYGYKTTYVYSTLGNKTSPPRLRYLDYLDLDDDGVPEVLFGISIAQFPLYTVVLHRQVDEWKELGRYNHSRCHG
jgi:hypothetical protein